MSPIKTEMSRSPSCSPINHYHPAVAHVNTFRNLRLLVCGSVAYPRKLHLKNLCAVKLATPNRNFRVSLPIHRLLQTSHLHVLAGNHQMQCEICGQRNQERDLEWPVDDLERIKSMGCLRADRNGLWG